MRTVAAEARALWEVSLAPAREASSSTTMAPTLCRLPAYLGPGLPRPTTSQVPSSLTGRKYAGRSAESRPGAQSSTFGAVVPAPRIDRCAVDEGCGRLAGRPARARQAVPMPIDPSLHAWAV